MVSKLGVDDYVVKPFSPKELMARVNAVITRHEGADHGTSNVMKFDGLEVNFAARTIYIDGKRVNLTPKEYDLLFYLIQNRNIALSRDKLLSDIWGYDFFGDDRTIDTHIKNLRNNLGPYRDFIVTQEEWVTSLNMKTKRSKWDPNSIRAVSLMYYGICRCNPARWYGSCRVSS